MEEKDKKKKNINSMGINFPGDKPGENDATDDLHNAAGASSESKKAGSFQANVILEPLEGPVGVDIGTSRIVEYHKEGFKFANHTQLNASFSVPFSSLTKRILEQNKFLYTRNSQDILVIGDGAVNFANIANREVRRPMADGVINPDEENGPTILEHIVTNIVQKPESLGAKLCFSMPAPQRDKQNSLVYHETMLRNYFVKLGYFAKGITEGFLIVLSEMQENAYTGIGISCGAGLCNVCLSYLSVPIFAFSIPKAGDYIDNLTAMAVGEHVNRVRVIKEESLSLVDEPRTRIDKALNIYYEDVIGSLIQNLKQAMAESENMPRIDEPIPIVLSGGTAMPDGFRDKFDNILRESNLPIEISEVRMAEDPLIATARGAYMAACMEEEGEEAE